MKEITTTKLKKIYSGIQTLVNQNLNGQILVTHNGESAFVMISQTARERMFPDLGKFTPSQSIPIHLVKHPRDFMQKIPKNGNLCVPVTHKNRIICYAYSIEDHSFETGIKKPEETSMTEPYDDAKAMEQKESITISIARLRDMPYIKIFNLISKLKDKRILISNNGRTEAVIISPSERKRGLFNKVREEVGKTISITKFKLEHVAISNEMRDLDVCRRIVTHSDKLIGFVMSPNLVNEIDKTNMSPIFDEDPEEEVVTNMETDTQSEEIKGPSGRFMKSGLRLYKEGSKPKQVKAYLDKNQVCYVLSTTSSDVMVCTRKYRDNCKIEGECINHSGERVPVGKFIKSYDSWIAKLEMYRETLRYLVVSIGRDSYYVYSTKSFGKLRGDSQRVSSVKPPQENKTSIKVDAVKSKPQSKISISTRQIVKIPWDVLNIEMPHEGGSISYNKDGIVIHVES